MIAKCKLYGNEFQALHFKHGAKGRDWGIKELAITAQVRTVIKGKCNASVAQFGYERSLDKRKVLGSNPSRGTKNKKESTKRRASNVNGNVITLRLHCVLRVVGARDKNLG